MADLPVLQPVRPVGDSAPVVEVAFKGNRRGYFYSDDDTLRVGEHVLVEVERGQDLGRVQSVGGVAARKCSGCASGQDREGTAAATPTLRVLRRAEREEVERLAVLRADEDRARRTAREMVEQHGLKMKVTESEWQWDKNKLTIYFTADRRVDFRQLVRELARAFRTRIELKQIGVRDEAALLGGVGRCGRELCCATWLREIKPVSLQLAKDQNLSLNPTQISGTCGRLMCCLTYEHDAYLQARKRFPREGKLLRTSRGQEKVIGIDIWRDEVTLLDENRQRRVATLAELRTETQGPGTAAPREREEPGAAAEADASRTRAETGDGVETARTAPASGSEDAPGERGQARRGRPRKAPSKEPTAAAEPRNVSESADDLPRRARKRPRRRSNQRKDP